MSSAMLELTPELRGELCVEHALGVWSAWSLGNYYRLFKLYERGPNLAKELMGLFLARERKQALRIICRAYVTLCLCVRACTTACLLCSYRPSLSVATLISHLKFSSRDECLTFLTESNAVLDSGQNTLDCKLTTAVL